MKQVPLSGKECIVHLVHFVVLKTWETGFYTRNNKYLNKWFIYLILPIFSDPIINFLLSLWAKKQVSKRSH